MDKSADDSTKAKGTQIKVKFKGSKLAIGSSKMPNATVSTYFMSKLTALNISMLGGTPVAPVQKKKQKVEEMDRVEEESDRTRRRRVTIAANPTEIPLPTLPPQSQTPAPPQAPTAVRAPDSIEATVPSSIHRISNAVKPAVRVKSEDTAAPVVIAAGSATASSQVEVVSDRTVGGLCLPSSAPASTSTSTLYALQHNRKHFLKTVEAIDPTEMDVTCDFDFWLWLEAQKIFAPFSYKTHDLSVVALQGIGKEVVLSRWSSPPLGARAVSAATPTHSNSHPSSSSTTTSFAGVEHHSGQEPGQVLGLGQSVLSALLESGGPANGIIAPGPSNGHHVCTSNSSIHSINNVNSCVDSCIGSSSSSSAGVGRPDMSTTNRGVDDAPGHDHYPISAAAAMVHGALLAALDGPPRQDLVTAGHTQDVGDDVGLLCPVPPLVDDDSPSIDSYIEQLQVELVHNNLALNGTIARLRRESLQSPSVRGELDAHIKQQEREKAIITKWRKSKSFLASQGASSSHITAGNAGAGNGKAKTTHKKKLGTY